MKLLGDVPEEHKELAKQLLETENYFDQKDLEHLVANEIRAKAYVCLAHDWYQIGCEEEGEKLLLKAEKVCPGYFKEIMVKHTEEDSDFNLVVKQLTSEVFFMLVDKIKQVGNK